MSFLGSRLTYGNVWMPAWLSESPLYCNNGYYNRAAIAQEIRENYSSQAVAATLMKQYQKVAEQKDEVLQGVFA